MTVLPVIERELRTQARQTFTYTLRVLGATALLAVCGFFGLQYGFAPRLGGSLFGYLHCALVVSIWVIVPLICADSISQERREGTAGLLFLTPLNERDIVLAKGLVHGVRAMTLLLAVLPVMTISFLLGGVTWREAVLSALVNFSCICWALAAGLLASSVCKSWLRSVILSGGIAGCFSVALILLTGWRVISVVRNAKWFALPFPYYQWNWQRALEHNFAQIALPMGFFSVTDLAGWWGTAFGSLPAQLQQAWLLQECLVALISFLALMLMVHFAAWNFRRTWQEEPPSARRIWLEQKLATPIIGVKFFHRWLRRSLEKNPIGWLERRTWSGRLVTWGWFAVMVSFYTVVSESSNAWRLLAAVQDMLAWMMVGIIAVSASGSFQRERESRVLELLLVSPMSAQQVIWGRLRGLWGQFAPAAALLLVVWAYLVGVFRPVGHFSLVPFFCGSYIALPVIGLYYSLSRKHFVRAFLCTIAMGVFVPFALKWALVSADNLLLPVFGLLGSSLWEGSFPLWLYISVRSVAEWPPLIAVIQIATAAVLGRKLHRNLEERKFAFV
jgi:ABC-type transport system involved in multi-copper enzyme maturation permease subunit